MVGVEATFREASAQARIASIPMAHLSIEVGHVYKEDLEAGPDRLRALFSRVSPWQRAAEGACARPARTNARVSTCFLIDDYGKDLPAPAEVIAMVLDTAAEHGVRIDYLARESGCAEANGVALTEIVLGRIVENPARGTTGARPPAKEVGWLCNGERSPATGERGGEAMSAPRAWAPPVQNSDNRHSIFVDVELWSDTSGRRTWSCAFLAAVWQLLRLGLLRNLGEGVAMPAPLPSRLPAHWHELPAVMLVNPKAAAFSAYRTFSVLDGRFLETEHAVRTILSQFAAEPDVMAQTHSRSAAEGIDLPPDVIDRMGYTLLSR